jgi:RimJ/RimL family protein N-acetyltransferase
LGTNYLGPDPATLSMIGRNVALGPLRQDLSGLYQGWRSDFTTLRPAGDLDDDDADGDVWTWYDEMTSSDEHVWFTIYELVTGKPVGLIGLIDIDYDEKSAEFFLHVGEVASQTAELGSEAGRLVRDYAFTALGLLSLFSMAYEYNLSELNYCETAGFREFTRRRQAHFVGGRLWDVIYLECLAGGTAAAGPTSSC